MDIDTYELHTDLGDAQPKERDHDTPDLGNAQPEEREHDTPDLSDTQPEERDHGAPDLGAADLDQDTRPGATSLHGATGRYSRCDGIHHCFAKSKLRNPLRELPDSDTTDPDLILSLKFYFANTTIKAYNTIRDATMERHPDDDIYSHHRIKRTAAEISGVVPIVHDMCPNTCLAFTGPYTDIDHDECPRCGEERWDTKKSTAQKKVACQTFDTCPVGPQLQALWLHPDHAEKMRWRVFILIYRLVLLKVYMHKAALQLGSAGPTERNGAGNDADEE
ncbi:uncharacterized protein F5147DRAFT_837832 [Suillus discolor]|uniref:Uncharacterized protein n=1 Tax=Suillus discolor TaxID=1912936 RepID=A0A9P7JSZ8_9AGAM|nr:uncharacterized protein F5147DRAFT_837832 [Suillus discolor]KAG2106604.1 hypothetical protein F5147DRAFT_837832 [Suillus discolor]